MAKTAPKKKITVNRKAIAAVTLLVALALSVVFIVLGFTGRQMDAQGLYKLLPWLPTTSQSSTWRQALVPGAGLGDTLVSAFTPVVEGEPASEDLDRAVNVLAKRLNDMGWTDAAVEQKDGQLLVTLPQGADTAYLNSLLAIKGDFTFTDPSGIEFMNGSNVTGAGFGYADQSGTNLALSLQFDAQGKQAFADKSTELAGQSISLRRDGVVLVSPGISEPITQGQVSIPGFTMESARENAVLLRSGALPFALELSGEGTPGTALLGAKVQNTLLIALAVLFALVAVYLLVCFRLAGFLAVWMLALQLAFSFFFAGLMGAGFTVLTLSAIMLGFVITVFAILRLYFHVRQDVGRGRSVRQAFKEACATSGHAGLDVFAGLLLVSVVLIIMGQGLVTVFSELFALTLLLGLVITQLLHRALLNEAIHLFGAKGSLYTFNPITKEA